MIVIWIIIAAVAVSLSFLAGMFTAYIMDQKDHVRRLAEHQDAIDDISSMDPNRR